jgi:hypothetical protein
VRDGVSNGSVVVDNEKLSYVLFADLPKNVTNACLQLTDARLSSHVPRWTSERVGENKASNAGLSSRSCRREQVSGTATDKLIGSAAATWS